MKALLISLATSVELLKLVIKRSSSLILLEATGPLLSGPVAVTLTMGLVVVFVATTSPSSFVVVVVIILTILILAFIALSGIGAMVDGLHSASGLSTCHLKANRIWGKCNHGVSKRRAD